jgi:hypothetical protein
MIFNECEVPGMILLGIIFPIHMAVLGYTEHPYCTLEVSDDWMLKSASLILFLLLRVRVIFALFFGLTKFGSQAVHVRSKPCQSSKKTWQLDALHVKGAFFFLALLLVFLT